MPENLNSLYGLRWQCSNQQLRLHRVHNKDDPALIEFCGQVTRALKECGVILVEDPRFRENLNHEFVSTMQKFFSNIGGVHTLVEHGKNVFHIRKTLTEEDLEAIPMEYHPNTVAIAEEEPEPEINLHYSWEMGPRTVKEPKIFSNTVHSMANTMLETVKVVAEMIGIGFGLSKETFSSLIDKGPHVLAPHGANLGIFEGTVLAPYHYNSNFLTIQGRSRYLGLNVWLNNGRKVEVTVPAGCLLVQTGKQIEWLTAGNFKAVMQEVIVTDRTIEALTEAKEQNRSLWGISSTLYVQIAPDVVLKPLECFVGSPLEDNYPPTRAGDLDAGIND